MIKIADDITAALANLTDRPRVRDLADILTVLSWDVPEDEPELASTLATLAHHLHTASRKSPGQFLNQAQMARSVGTLH